MTKERLWIWLAWHMPRGLTYWAYIRVASAATVYQFPTRTPDEVSILDALGAWTAQPIKGDAP